ncbi:MAG: hypothetical protein DRI32_05295 [Chloroflexi bacterium]|nr:MAG: hypothetical protein DRI32_05295 [Chloroflexota bacterium]
MQDQFGDLHKFIANNDDLEMLEAKLSEFNPFKVLKIDKFEIRHSTILAWLLNPRENHNLHDAFLKKILAEVIINNEHLDTGITAFKTQEMSYSDIEVETEWNNIDIFLVSKKNKLAILIENKIRAKESKGQLRKYINIVNSQYSSYKVVPVFLTLTGDEPSANNKDRYGIISYSQILKILKFIISIQKENLNPKVFDFLSYYQRILEISTMEDESIKKLCKKIYKEHKNALDLIYKYADETEFESAASEFIASLDAREISINGKQAWFLPRSILSKIKKVGLETWSDEYPLTFRFVALDEKLGIILEVGQFANGVLRKKFLEHLKENGFTIHNRSLEMGAKYTRIFTKYPKFLEWDDKESIIQKMDDLLNKTAKKAVDNLENACTSFDWENV